MNEFKVGLLALTAMASLAYMSIKITGTQSGFGDYTTYRTIVKDASGIFPKTSIRVAGINAGRIKKIELQGNTALITFEILNKVIITKGSKLRIKTVGFLGDKFLEVKVGEGRIALIENTFILSEDGAGFEKIMKDVSEVVGDVRKIVLSLKDTLAPEGEISPLKKILRDVEGVISNTKIATESLRKVISGNEKRLNDIILNLEIFSKQLAFHLNKNEKESAMSDIKEILSYSKKATRDISEIISDIKAGKGTIGKLAVEEEIADEVRQTLSGIKKMVGRVEAIRTELSIFTGANSKYGGVTDANLKILPSPERFYLLGISTSRIAPIKENSTETITNGSSSTTVTKRQQEGEILYNIQVGRRIHNWSFRGGLIESSGGLGVDYFFDRWGTVFSSELFDYRNKLGINIRLSTEVRLWNILYSKVSYEDILNNTQSYSLSIGLRFNDEDLKGLIGFFL